MIRSMLFILVVIPVLLQCGANHDEVSSRHFTMLPLLMAVSTIC